MFGHKNRTESGFILIDGKEVGTTTQCVHCGRHVWSQPGSGKVRGHCLKCDGWLCGDHACISECRPFEQRLDEWEAFWNKGKRATLRLRAW